MWQKVSRTCKDILFLLTGSSLLSLTVTATAAVVLENLVKLGISHHCHSMLPRKRKPLATLSPVQCHLCTHCRIESVVACTLTAAAHYAVSCRTHPGNPPRYSVCILKTSLQSSFGFVLTVLHACSITALLVMQMHDANACCAVHSLQSCIQSKRHLWPGN